MTAARERTILVLAYTLSPVRGSEYAVGWDYVEHMSHGQRLIVLYGAAGDHIGDVEEVTDEVIEGFRDRVEFHPVPPTRLVNALNYFNRTGWFPFAFYFAYRAWHKRAWRAAEALIARKQVDIAHYLCPIGYREPGYLWKLDLPYIWGPIGGMNMRPLKPFFGLNFAIGVKALGRNSANWLQFRLSPRLRKAIRRADVLIANTTQNLELIRSVYGRTALLMPENAIDALLPPQGQPNVAGPLRLIWVGRVDTAKALDILIAALALIGPGGWSLEVVGDGPRFAHARRMSEAAGIDGSITWLGKVSRAVVAERFLLADVHILTSLAEAHSTVLWEAMSRGVPTVAFDHCGMHDSICDACGVRIPLGDINEMQQRLADVLRELLADRARVGSLSTGAMACAERFSWERRTAEWQAIYDRAVQHWESRR